MYSAQGLSDRIKILAKKKRVIISKMLSDCGLNANTLNQISEERGTSSFSLAKMSDYLDCSVDYLLGRTDNPNAHISHASNVAVNQNNDEQLAEIIKIYEQLSPLGKAKVYVFIDEVLGKERTGNLP